MFLSAVRCKVAKAYQLIFVISVVLVITLSLTLPIANFVVVNFSKEKIGIEVGLLKCFSDICNQNPIQGVTSKWIPDLDEAIIPDAENLKDLLTPRFVKWAKVGSVGTIFFFMLALIATLFHVVSLTVGGREVELYMQELFSMCWKDPTDMISSRILVAGSIFLLIGVVWYPIVTCGVLNGGEYVYGFWIAFVAAIASLGLTLFAFRDKSAWAYLKGFNYEPIPTKVEQGEDDQFPGYRTP